MPTNQERLAKLETELAELKKEMTKEEEWPKDGDMVWFINDCGMVFGALYVGIIGADDLRKDFLGVFKTEAEAIAQRDRIKALCNPNRWKPGKGIFYYFVGWQGAYCAGWDNDPIDLYRFAQGNVHKTKADAEQYKKLLGL